jgi:hypothetical protein
MNPASAGFCLVGLPIAIVDSGGDLVMLQRLDNTRLASPRLAEYKARTAVEFRRPRKIFEDAPGQGAFPATDETTACFIRSVSTGARCHRVTTVGHLLLRRVVPENSAGHWTSSTRTMASREIVVWFRRSLPDPRSSG